MGYASTIFVYVVPSVLFVGLIATHNMPKLNYLIRCVIGPDLIINVRTDTRVAVAFNLLYYFRRIIMSFNGFYLRDYPCQQI